MENTICPMCSGEGQLLGQLGSLLHFRCRNCGTYFNSKEVENHLESFEHALARFIETMQGVIDAHFAANYTRVTPPQLRCDEGGVKYIRVVQEDRGASGGSAWCFIERSTGNILKCDGWKRPAKGIRGSIYAKDAEGYGCTRTGPKYAR